ncbi:uncharacterized protein K452DRAFT_252835 [Aplosporella prunicola CBS 121167]|uniref:SGS domain-containing protein n=1 Tax=Aplosporella prunicola CBS 121167 TaxID=1176127 RepID=A0A6A6B7V9_9PEZI|nr:uncharacterized protein K452DRAFT_252835 [Aplosporella prunicola CBS 121167]KAF2140170.1 hypothetical protein K452DRAFT_252835 [Aplosporella prunicola CBS 121167]
MDQAKAAAAALEAKNYDEAIDLYTKALAQNTTAVAYYIGRSTAYQRTAPPNLDAALKDAELAVALAHKRGKRELIIDAQLRRAITLFTLGRYGDAQFVFGIVKKLDTQLKTLPMWESKLSIKFRDMPEDDERKNVTVAEVPDVEAPTEAPKPAQKASENKQTSTPTMQVTPADKIRYDWYQGGQDVTINILAKGVAENTANIEMDSRSLEVSFPTASGSTYAMNLDPLFAPIAKEQSTVKFFPSKVEVILRKAVPNQKWPALEGTPDATSTASEAAPISRPAPASTAAPSYPTSSRTGPKNWDKLVDDMTKKKSDKKEGGGDGDEDFDDLEDEGGDPANAFFKKLYKSADPDTRRAMMKSYQESNGTSLSTNWAEVSKGKVETSPPDGMEARPW